MTQRLRSGIARMAGGIHSGATRISRPLRSRNARMLRWGRFGMWLLAVAGVWGLFQLHSSTQEQDARLLLSVSIVYGVGILVMLIGTDEWTARNLGLFSTITADALLYGLGALAALRYIDPVDEPEVDLIRALFAIGGTLLLIGLLRWMSERGVSRRERVAAGVTAAVVITLIALITGALVW